MRQVAEGAQPPTVAPLSTATPLAKAAPSAHAVDDGASLPPPALPGYRIQRLIGAGGSARVYLAVQQAYPRQVAIKLLSPEALAVPAARNRFQQEAAIVQRLDHPNIVRVLDAGFHGKTPYLAMEYLRGGDLNWNLRAGLHMQNVLMVAKEIASALDYAHGKGVVHGDVKPENILFNAQGTALLADFGIATVLARGAGQGAAPRLGTPPYASPEQLRGEPLDGRSDFFNLGVVFYAMLTGRMPFGGSDAAHEAASRQQLPPLPASLGVFQEVVGRFLAPLPAERFQTAGEIVAALDAVRLAGGVPNVVVRVEAVSTGEIEAAVGGLQQLGDTGGAPRARLRGRRLAALVLGGFLAAALLGGGYLATRPGGLTRALALAGLAEHPDVTSAWAEAEALRLDPNQGLGVIVAAYRQVLARDAGHAGAANAVVAAVGQWKADASVALEAGDADLAAAKLDELATVAPEDDEIPPLVDRLDDLRHSGRLLANMQRLLARSGLDDVPSVETAIVAYKEVLRLRPGNVEARSALEDIAVHYGALAERDARNRDVVAAMENFERAVAAMAEFDGVAAVRSTLSEAEAVQAEINALLQRAAELRQAGDLIAPANANAAETYRRVLATKPDDAVAIQGLAEVSAQVLADFRDLLEQGDLDAARALVDRAAAAAIGDDPVAEMQVRIDAELDRIAAVAEHLAEAETLYGQGYITGPSREDNVVAHLREVLRLDPDNADAIRLLSVAATRLAQAAEEAHDAGLVEEGLLYLDLALTVTPGIGRWREMRERWQLEVPDSGSE